MVKLAPSLFAVAVAVAVAGRACRGQADHAATVRGMTVSCPTFGQEWGTDDMVATMRELEQLGVTWIAIHPYAGINDDGSLRCRRLSDPEAPPMWITRPIAEAHRLGLKILVKPHLAYWMSRFRWRGDITFTRPEEWSRFFAGYERWIADVAAMSSGADAFAVGCELDGTVRYEKRWRHIIAAVRARYAGPITYAANWSSYRSVRFWDALDVVGIQAYFPLIEKDAAGGETPTRERLAEGWRRIMAEMKAFSRATSRKIVFTELGYNASARAPYEPWDDATGGPAAEVVQARCLTAALEAIDRESSVCGAFLWKWFPGRREPRNFNKSSPAMRRVIAQRWAAPARPSPTSRRSAK